MNDGDTITFFPLLICTFIHSSFPLSFTFSLFIFLLYRSVRFFFLRVDISPCVVFFLYFVRRSSPSSSSHFCSFSWPSSAKKNEEAHILRVMMTVWSKAEKGYLTSVRESEKKEGQTSKAARRKNKGENTGVFLILLLLLLHSLSLFTSLSLVFWIFGKVVREEKKKEDEEQREKKMTRYCPQILSTYFDILLLRLHLSLCDHLLGV